MAQAPRDALPGAKDPASEGPQLLPAAAFKLHGVRPEERRDRYSGAASGRVSVGDGLGRAWGHAVDITISMGVPLLPDAGLAAGWQEQQPPKLPRPLPSFPTAPSFAPLSPDCLQDYSKAKVVAAAAPAPKPAVDKSRETPAERLKRLMAAQLNKKIQKDSLQASQVRGEGGEEALVGGAAGGRCQVRAPRRCAAAGLRVLRLLCTILTPLGLPALNRVPLCRSSRCRRRRSGRGTST